MDEHNKDENTPQKEGAGDNEQRKPTLPPEPPASVKLKSAETLSSIAMVSGFVSVVFGGVMLSIVGLICGIIALTKLKSVAPSIRPNSSEHQLFKRIRLSIIVCVVAGILNAYSLAIVLPTLMETLNSGTLDSILGASTTSSAATSSIWG